MLLCEWRQFIVVLLDLLLAISPETPVIDSIKFLVFNFWVPRFISSKVVTAVKISQYQCLSNFAANYPKFREGMYEQNVWEYSIKFISLVYLCAMESDHSSNSKALHTTATTKQEDIKPLGQSRTVTLHIKVLFFVWFCRNICIL